MKRFENKVVLITGAVGGLGTLQLHMFAEQGASIAINHLDLPEFTAQAEAMVKELTEKYGGVYRNYGADVTDEAAVTAMIAKIVADFGHLDVLINNAGIMVNGLAWKFDVNRWRKIIDVNVNGTFICTKAVLPHMRERQYGRIVNLSSIGGLSGIKASPAYSASKAAVIGLAKSVARDVANKGITVNCVAPGYIAAGMMDGVSQEWLDKELLPFVPMGKMGRPEDVANAITFLASDEAAYITGEVIRIDGGYAM